MNKKRQQHTISHNNDNTFSHFSTNKKGSRRAIGNTRGLVGIENSTRVMIVCGRYLWIGSCVSPEWRTLQPSVVHKVPTKMRSAERTGSEIADVAAVPNVDVGADACVFGTSGLTTTMPALILATSISKHICNCLASDNSVSSRVILSCTPCNSPNFVVKKASMSMTQN